MEMRATRSTGLILQKFKRTPVSDQSLEIYFREHIFEPLGMTHTLFYDDNNLVVPNRAAAAAGRHGAVLRSAEKPGRQYAVRGQDLRA